MNSFSCILHTKQTIGSSTPTFYPNDFYNVTGTTSIRQYMAGDSIVATMRVLITGPQLFYIHTDHLGSPTITTNTSGGIVETQDYYPYGALKFDTPTGTFKEPRKFIGEEYDPETALSYLNARYYDGTRGQFLSQDPVFLAVGEDPIPASGGAVDLPTYLSDPQAMNSYGYARNNPVALRDSDGELLDTVLDVGFIAYDLYRVGRAALTGGDVRSELGYLALDLGGAAIPGGTGFGLAARSVKKAADVSIPAAQVTKKTETLLLNTQRGNLLTGVENQKLKNIISNTYRQNDVLSGGTPAAIRYTRETGVLVGGTDHIQKGFDTLKGLQNILNSGVKLGSGDVQKLTYLLNEFSSALAGLNRK